jgi:hypothetical protein
MGPTLKCRMGARFLARPVAPVVMSVVTGLIGSTKIATMIEPGSFLLVLEASGKLLQLGSFLPIHFSAIGMWSMMIAATSQKPHTERIIGLGTLNVRDYLKNVRPLRLEAASFSSASIETYGPDGCYGAMLYVGPRKGPPNVTPARWRRAGSGRGLSPDQSSCSQR